MSLCLFKTAKKREARGQHDREITRNYFYALMFLCPYVFLKPRITRMWQIFDNSIIRDKNHDNREATRRFFKTANYANVADIR